VTLQIATSSRLGDRVVDVDDVSLPESLVSQLGAVAGQPPAADAEIKHAEALLGIELPTPSRDLYLRVGNGASGPATEFSGWTADSGTTSARPPSTPIACSCFPIRMRPPGPDVSGESHCCRSATGGVVYTAVDCRTSDARVVGFDEGTWIEDGRPLAQWLKDWLADPQMPQPLP